MPVQPPLKARDRQARNAVAQRRNLLHLHLALGPDEQQFDLVAQPPFQRLGDRYGRVDMASGSTSGKNDFFHYNLRFNVYGLYLQLPRHKRRSASR